MAFTEVTARLIFLLDCVKRAFNIPTCSLPFLTACREPAGISQIQPKETNPPMWKKGPAFLAGAQIPHQRTLQHCDTTPHVFRQFYSAVNCSHSSPYLPRHFNHLASAASQALQLMSLSNSPCIHHRYWDYFPGAWNFRGMEGRSSIATARNRSPRNFFLTATRWRWDGVTVSSTRNLIIMRAQHSRPSRGMLQNLAIESGWDIEEEAVWISRYYSGAGRRGQSMTKSHGVFRKPGIASHLTEAIYAGHT